MATTVFTALNNSPDLSQEDNNWTIQPFFALKSQGVTIDSTAGLTSAGPIEPGSYSNPMDTGTNKTMLGGVKTARSLHYNSQAMTLQMNLVGITPFGNQIRHKNNLIPVVTYAATGSTTVAAAGGTTKTITLTLATGFAVGKEVEIEMASGQPEYRRVDGISGSVITLDHPLFVAPADGAAVKVVAKIDYKVGGSRPQKYSGLVNCSGDYSDRLIQFYNDLRVNSGNANMPDGNAGGLTLNLEAFPQNETILARVEPIFLTERLQFEDIA